MNKYLLLRDNKQTGPYSVEELVKKGIKPYDLVWLEGRSAAWRYPSEMEDLKPFAPAVEEQPYDRFYKRSSSAQEHAVNAAQNQSGKQDQTIPAVEHTSEIPFTSAQASEQSAATVQGVAAQQSIPAAVSSPQEQPVQEIPIAKPLPKTGTGKVYVTLPAGFRQQPAATAQVIEKKTQPVIEIKAGQEVKKDMTIEKVAAAGNTPIAGNATLAEEDSAGVSKEAAKALEARAEALARSVQLAAAEAAAKKQSAQQYVQEWNAKQAANAAQLAAAKAAAPVAEQPAKFSTLINKHQREETVPVIPMHSSGKKHRMLMRGIVAACLLLGGIVIGMALTYSKSGSSNQQALDQLVQRLQERESSKQTTLPQAQTAEDPNSVSNAAYAEETAPPPDDDQSAVPANNSSAQQVAVKEKPTVSSPVTDQEAAITYQEKTPATMKVMPAVVTQKEEPKPVRAEEVAATRQKIYQMVQVEASSFETGVLGGISNLYFTISNTSSFPLDQIELEIKYLGPERRVVKVQRLLFSDIAANGQQTLEAPRTSRGVSIDYVVTKINSRALGIAHAGF